MPAGSQYLRGPSTQKKPAQNLISFLTGGNGIQAYNKSNYTTEKTYIGLHVLS